MDFEIVFRARYGSRQVIIIGVSVAIDLPVIIQSGNERSHTRLAISNQR